jgi:hypothetical protein
MSSLLKNMPRLPKRSSKQPSIPTEQSRNGDAQESTTPLRVAANETEKQQSDTPNPAAFDVKQRARKIGVKVGRVWDRTKQVFGRNSWRMVERLAFAFRLSW